MPEHISSLSVMVTVVLQVAAFPKESVTYKVTSLSPISAQENVRDISRVDELKLKPI